MTWWERALAFIRGGANPGVAEAPAEIAADNKVEAEETAFALQWRLADPIRFGSATKDKLHDILVAELGLPIYNGLTADAAYALLTQPRTVTTTRPSETRVTAQGLFGMLGLQRAPRVTAALRTMLKEDFDLVFGKDGVLVAHPDTQAVIGQLVASAVITQPEADKLLALGVEPVSTTYPPRQCTALGGVAGAPNLIERADFDAAWSEAR